MSVTAWALLDLTVGCAYLAAALLVRSRGRARLPALLLALTGATWFLGNFAALTGAVGAFVAAGIFVHRGLLSQLVLTLPTGRPRSRTVLAAVIVAYAVAFVPWAARSEAVTLAVCTMLMAVTWRERRWMVDALPVTLLVAALAVPAIARLTLSAAAAGPALAAYDACLFALAAALAARLVRPPRMGVADLVVGLVQTEGVAPARSLRDALARAVGDPTLQVAYLAGEGYVDAQGSPITPGAADGRIVTPLLRDGREFGFISHDPAVLADPLLVEAVATAADLTSANARLQADVERQAAEIRASRRRIVTAGLEERRRLEAELRQGPGARLERVTELLEAALLLPAGAVDQGVLDTARRQAADARTDLRDLARGLHPLAVRTSGLAGAVADLAISTPMPVSVEVDVSALPDEVAATAYYVCAEGLTNAARHAHARSASVCIGEADGAVRVSVADDGSGGADPDGTGLRGLADRVQALGGRLDVTSDPDGTRLCAWLPRHEA